MNHAGTIFAALIAAFVFYVAANNRLRNYIAVIWGATAAPLPKEQSSGGGSSTSSDIANVAKIATVVAGG